MNLVRALEDDWQAALDHVARARGFPLTTNVAALGAAVRALSDAYNAGTAPPPSALAARLGFSFARDVPKAAGAVRELIATGVLGAPAGRVLRVLDLGAGLGASTWGLVRALAFATGTAPAVDAILVDENASALGVARSIVDARKGSGLRVETELSQVAKWTMRNHAPFDVILLGQVISELDGDKEPEVRAKDHAALIAKLASQALADDGAIVVIEPALRDRTRHLHQVRDTLVKDHALTVFAPCLHLAPCPALAVPTNWCHEDLPVDLPAWLIPVARAAGLRFEGLTFSYLVLRRDGRTLATELAAKAGGKPLLRVVSEPLITKGKREAFLCGKCPGRSGDGAERVKVMRLNREATVDNDAFEMAVRGDVLAVEPELDWASPIPRISRTHKVSSV